MVVKRIFFLVSLIVLFFLSSNPTYAQTVPGANASGGSCPSGMGISTNDPSFCCPVTDPYSCGTVAYESNGMCGATQASCFGQPGAYDGPCNSGNTCNNPALTCDTTFNKCLIKQGSSCFQYNYLYTCARPYACLANPSNSSQKTCTTPPSGTPTGTGVPVSTITPTLLPGATGNPIYAKQSPFLTPYKPDIGNMLLQAFVVVVIAGVVYLLAKR